MEPSTKRVMYFGIESNSFLQLPSCRGFLFILQALYYVCSAAESCGFLHPVSSVATWPRLAPYSLDIIIIILCPGSTGPVRDGAGLMPVPRGYVACRRAKRCPYLGG